MPLDQVSLAVRPGEIVGIAGISGNGQSELMRAPLGRDAALAGQRPAHPARTMRRIGALGPRGRRRLGITFVPEDRQGRGTVAALSLAMNTLLTARSIRILPSAA